MFKEPLRESVTGRFVTQRQCLDDDLVAVDATLFEVILDGAGFAGQNVVNEAGVLQTVSKDGHDFVGDKNTIA